MRATKLCIKFKVAYKRYPIVFQGHLSNFKVTRSKKNDFNPNWAFLFRGCFFMHRFVRPCRPSNCILLPWNWWQCWWPPSFGADAWHCCVTTWHLCWCLTKALLETVFRQIVCGRSPFWPQSMSFQSRFGICREMKTELQTCCPSGMLPRTHCQGYGN